MENGRGAASRCNADEIADAPGLLDRAHPATAHGRQGRAQSVVRLTRQDMTSRAGSTIPLVGRQPTNNQRGAPPPPPPLKEGLPPPPRPPRLNPTSRSTGGPSPPPRPSGPLGVAKREGGEGALRLIPPSLPAFSGRLATWTAARRRAAADAAQDAFLRPASRRAISKASSF